ncbi:MAG: chromate efflux transporter [Acidobacteriia bacterium]|nr:chromate efflux transporter [Terriglobia bacterium]
MATNEPSARTSLWDLAGAFLKLGTIAFGGPAAHIALMEQEFVRRRQWLTEQEFLDRLAAANLIPGPSSTEMAIYIGFTQRGWPGLIVAGCCFIVPAAVIVCMIAAAYVHYGTLPQVGGALYGLKPVMIAIILQAFWKLARSAVKTSFLAVIGIVSTVLCFLGVYELLVLLCAGVLAGVPAVAGKLRGSSETSAAISGPFSASLFKMKPLIATVSSSAALVAAPFSLTRLFFTFLKIGSVLFGSGYVLLAFLRADFVQRLHWLTEKQLLDAVAVGQITPGPVFTTATFIGYLQGGVPGAIVATFAIFLPGFFLVAASGPIIPMIRRSAVASAFLDGVVVGSLALMGYVTWLLGKTALIDPLTIVLAIASAALLFRFRINPVWLMAAAAIAGVLHGA